MKSLRSVALSTSICCFLKSFLALAFLPGPFSVQSCSCTTHAIRPSFEVKMYALIFTAILPDVFFFFAFFFRAFARELNNSSALLKTTSICCLSAQFLASRLRMQVVSNNQDRHEQGLGVGVKDMRCMGVGVGGTVMEVQQT